MNRYRVIFHGRKIGAIGIFGFHCVDLEADSAESALLRCYETHEHISNPRVIDRETNKPIALPGQLNEKGT